jgi:hydrogenase maturation factor
LLPTGKIPSALLAEILGQLPPPPPEVLVGARPGEDAAVVDLGGRYLVFAMDPVTLADEPGRYAVQINANDIAVMGAEPRWLLATLIYPEGADERDVRTIMSQLQDACRQLGVTLIGGHTEVTDSVDWPIVAACMIGEASPDSLVRSAARPGDALLLAGPIAVEGTSILAEVYSDELLEQAVPPEVIERGYNLLADPGISVLPAVRALMSVARPHAMHDPTEGGLLGAVREMAQVTDTGVRVETERVLIHAPCLELCAALNLDPMALLASGSLLAAVAPEDAASSLEALNQAAIPSAIIGGFLPPSEGLTIRQGGRDTPLPEIPRDELARWRQICNARH